jgi:hypothetical protein
MIQSGLIIASGRPGGGPATDNFAPGHRKRSPPASRMPRRWSLSWACGAWRSPTPARRRDLLGGGCPGLFSWNESRELFESRPSVDNGLSHPAVATTMRKGPSLRGPERWSRLCKWSLKARSELSTWRSALASSQALGGSVFADNPLSRPHAICRGWWRKVNSHNRDWALFSQKHSPAAAEAFAPRAGRRRGLPAAWLQYPIHRTCFAVMYACGLRIGEAATLEIVTIAALTSPRRPVQRRRSG